MKEAAASLEGAAAEETRRSLGVVSRYVEAINDRNIGGAVSLWARGGRQHIHGLHRARAPDGVERLLRALLDALPDLELEILEAISDGDRCGVEWQLTGTFAGPRRLAGVAPSGESLHVRGLDLLVVQDGKIAAEDCYLDHATMPAEMKLLLGLPGIAARAAKLALNTKTEASTSAAEAQLVADRVWVLQGQPGRCNVYLIEDERGVTLFDAGGRTMARSIAIAAAKLGGIRRVVLGHGHTDHRGGASRLSAPVFCHPDEVQDAEGSGGFRYWPTNLAGLPTPQRQVHRLLHKLAWDGGPVRISGTVQEGEQVAGFEVVHLPGHAPGLIALWRDSDKLALCSDCFYTVDLWGRDSDPHVPERIYNLDVAQARDSIRKLAALEPDVAWPGHANALASDVRDRLQAAAELP